MKCSDGHIRYKAAVQQAGGCLPAPCFPDNLYYRLDGRVVDPAEGQPVPVRQPHLLAYPQLAGIVDQRDGRRGQEFVAPPHGVQSRTFPQGDPICRRVQLRFHLGKNGPILEHLQIRRNDEVWEHRIRPGQILRHMLRVSQAEKTNLQLNVFPVQPPGQLLQKRLFLAVQDADVVPIKQNVCHAR